MKLLGLIGHPLTHSFSQKHFKEKFSNLELKDYDYKLFDLPDISNIRELTKSFPDLFGLNVTVPFKQEIISFLDDMDSAAKEIGAVNTITIQNGIWKGYNTDYFGFKDSLLSIKSDVSGERALVLGSGGSSKAVQKVLQDLKVEFQIVSRRKYPASISYDEVKVGSLVSKHHLIINTTPIGMFPRVEEFPDIPYDEIDSSHILFDLVYNPQVTSFLKEGEKRGALTKNGLEMLYIQAERAWEIWTKE